MLLFCHQLKKYPRLNFFKLLYTLFHFLYNNYFLSFCFKILDPHDIRFSTWRQQRAAEHLRQQHERHSLLPDGTILVEPYDIPVAHVGDAARHLPPASVESFVRKNSPHLRPSDNSEPREAKKQVWI